MPGQLDRRPAGAWSEAAPRLRAVNRRFDTPDAPHVNGHRPHVVVFWPVTVGPPTNSAVRDHGGRIYAIRMKEAVACCKRHVSVAKLRVRVARTTT